MSPLEYISSLQKMSIEKFMEARQTEEYRELNSNKDYREQFKAMLVKRRGDERKREKILDALYTNPETLNWIKDIQAYRSLRVQQGWISMVIREGETGDKPMYEDLDRQRRQYHNKALKAFCRLVEATSSALSNRSNKAPSDGSYYIPRTENDGDLYSGPLMIPSEEPDNYGNHAVRKEMTDGMFQFLKFIEETNRSDWDIARQKILARKKDAVKQQGAPKIEEIQGDLIRDMRAWGVDESPENDDFGLDIYDKKDRVKYGRKDDGYDEI